MIDNTISNDVILGEADGVVIGDIINNVDKEEGGQDNQSDKQDEIVNCITIELPNAGHLPTASRGAPHKCAQQTPQGH
jgi:hypothetical protein